MNNQDELFDFEPDHTGHVHIRPKALDTRREALYKIQGNKLRAKVLGCLRQYENIGLTADECAGLLNETAFAIRPRFSELFKANLIEPTGHARKNASGRRAKVYRAIN